MNYTKYSNLFFKSSKVLPKFLISIFITNLWVIACKNYLMAVLEKAKCLQKQVCHQNKRNILKWKWLVVFFFKTL